MPRSKTLRVPVTPTEERRILARGKTLGYQSFAAYARTVLTDPLGPFIKHRLTEIARELIEAEAAVRSGDPDAAARIEAVVAIVTAWVAA